MRVITGKARGRRLREPKGMDIRPTTDMVKEAVFNILQFELEGARVLDLFAGTGQLGIEALSRGAAEAVFVDGSSAAVKIVRENLKLCGFEARVLQGDAIGYLVAADGGREVKIFGIVGYIHVYYAVHQGRNLPLHDIVANLIPRAGGQNLWLLRRTGCPSQAKGYE